MHRKAIFIALFALVQVALRGQTTAAPPAAKVDAIFSKWADSSPGCALGVAVGGEIVLEKGYGMADLERDVRIVPDTIFEAGSVSKQFTAAAILLLAKEGKLSSGGPVPHTHGDPITR